MTVRIKLFAILRDHAGTSEFTLDLPDRATVSTAVERLVARHPALASHLPRCATAVNLERATPNTPLNNND